MKLVQKLPLRKQFYIHKQHIKFLTAIKKAAEPDDREKDLGYFKKHIDE